MTKLKVTSMQIIPDGVEIFTTDKYDPHFSVSFDSMGINPEDYTHDTQIRKIAARWIRNYEAGKFEFDFSGGVILFGYRIKN